MIIVFTTTAGIKEAETLARKIVREKLAACVQVLPQMKSFYFWENEVQTDSEQLLLIKTLSEKYVELEKFIREKHSHDTPEIVAVKAESVSDNYFDWLSNYLK